jgi:hypothetical protein
MLKEMALIAAECVKNPRRRSVWVPALGKYVCPDSEEGRRALALEIKASFAEEGRHPPIDKQFKLVFLTAASGTLLFIVLCLVLTLLAGKEPPPLFEKVIMGFFDLAKIGFGAVVGLLGGKQLRGVTGKDTDGNANQTLQGKEGQERGVSSDRAEPLNGLGSQ